jgi:C4-dicarboxylate transporter, DctM subunit
MEGYIAVVIGMFLLLLAAGVWVGAAAATVGLTVLVIDQGWAKAFVGTEWVVFSAADSYTLTVVPLFLFMGLIMTESGLGKRIYSSISPLLNHFPGGLHYANILAGMLFAATSGSAIAATVSIGSMALPEMERRGYKYSDAAGSICAGALLSPLIPPSIIMIIYASLVDISIGRQFLAGVLPGLLLTGFFCLYLTTRYFFSAGQKEIRGERIPWLASIVKTMDIWPLLFLIVFVLGSIFSGVTTATEGAAMGVLAMTLLTVFYRVFTWRMIGKAAVATTKITCQIMFTYLGIKIMAVAFSRVGLLANITDFFLGLPVSPFMILLIIWAIFLVMGCVLEPIPMVMLVVPIILPTIEALGFDLIWFGIQVVVLVLIGDLTPPVGICLFAMQALRPDKPVIELYRGVAPYILIVLFLLIVVTVFPELSLLLPRIMLG